MIENTTHPAHNRYTQPQRQMTQPQDNMPPRCESPVNQFPINPENPVCPGAPMKPKPQSSRAENADAEADGVNCKRTLFQ
jgi:hypothetical protein